MRAWFARPCDQVRQAQEAANVGCSISQNSRYGKRRFESLCASAFHDYLYAPQLPKRTTGCGVNRLDRVTRQHLFRPEAAAGSETAHTT